MRRLILLFGLTISVAGCQEAVETKPSEPTPDVAAEGAESRTIRTATHLFEELADGVYFAVEAGGITLASNALVVVNEDNVLLVDSHITADAGRALVQSVKSITEKPIAYVVNTHWHFDHAHGNQVFGDEVAIIGHEYTRERMLDDPLAGHTYQTIGSPTAQSQILAAVEGQIASASGDQLDALNAQKAMLERHIEALAEVVPKAPDVTFTDRFSVREGAREIQILHFGRGHTGGDAVVYLPEERIAFTGDLLYPGAPYLGDAFADEFPDTLEGVKALDLKVIAGGHGDLMWDKSGIDRSQAYLRAYWAQVKASKTAGRSVDEAVAALDLSGYEDFAAFQLAAPGVLALEVGRMYERLDELGE